MYRSVRLSPCKEVLKDLIDSDVEGYLIQIFVLLWQGLVLPVLLQSYWCSQLESLIFSFCPKKIASKKCVRKILQPSVLSRVKMYLHGLECRCWCFEWCFIIWHNVLWVHLPEATSRNNCHRFAKNKYAVSRVKRLFNNWNILSDGFLFYQVSWCGR